MLGDDQILELARWAVTIEEHYSREAGTPTPMDIEWARDGRTGDKGNRSNISVIAWHPQPFKIPVPAGKGRRATKYTPDVAVEFAAQAGGTELHRVQLCEVKYRQELKDDWAELKPRLKAGLRYARSRGWTFKIYTEVEIRTPRLQNARFFLGYVQRGTDAMDVARLQQSLRALGTTTPTALFEDAQVSANEKGRMLGVLWHMVATGLVCMNFDVPLSMQSPIWCHDRA